MGYRGTMTLGVSPSLVRVGPTTHSALGSFFLLSFSGQLGIHQEPKTMAYLPATMSETTWASAAQTF